MHLGGDIRTDTHTALGRKAEGVLFPHFIAISDPVFSPRGRIDENARSFEAKFLKRELRWADDSASAGACHISWVAHCPLLTLWPTYDGRSKDNLDLSDPDDLAWGHIMAAAMRDIQSVLGGEWTHWVYARKSGPWWRLTRESCWMPTKQSYLGLSAQAINERSHMGHDYVIHLLDGPPASQLIEDLSQLDVTRCCKAALAFGIEEAVVFACFPEPEPLMPLFQRHSANFGHALVRSPVPFRSDWDRANPGLCPEPYREGAGG